MQLTNRIPAVLGMGALVLTSFLGMAQSQDATTNKPDAAKADAPKAEAKKRAEPKGRLPAHYGDVVDKAQREKIYAAQAKYLAEIKKLEDQLDAIKKQRDIEVEAVLTAEQKEKIAKLVAEAKAKRDATKKKPDAPAATTSTTAPVTKAPTDAK